ncbi:hypothetical protein S-CBS1_gp13 [Synechococcus phage S-CBS1]|uniref:hypothetical protein n=1 Tax=Synechococcus phage S-CBS1 TaxID=909297 RepID=UPI000231E289|nr:hypothetical protein S-CBS1_gp13 [Synechococcus phage S-CBS1]ADP06618.1 hypothetical protein S-CBS1_gp13 [Synechococcus phage S-CBS1]
MPADGGKREKQSFEAEFKRLPQSRIAEIQAMAQKLVKAVEAGEQLEGISDVSVADEVLVGWSGILDEDGEEVPYSETNKAILLEVPLMAASLVQAYFASLTDEKRKN